MSPYKLPFNYQMLLEKNKIEPDNANLAFKEYILPDEETLIAVGTDEDFLHDVIDCYQNAENMASKDKRFELAQVTPENKMQDKHAHDHASSQRGLVEKIKTTIKNYCINEAVDPDNIHQVFLTGGMLNVSAVSGERLKKILKDQLQKELDEVAANAYVVTSNSPQSGSILDGANILFSMPQFDQRMCVTKKEWQEDNSVLAKNLF